MRHLHAQVGATVLMSEGTELHDWCSRPSSASSTGDRLGAGEPLRAPAAHEERTLRQLCELREEVLHEERLPDSRLAHHRQDPAAALALPRRPGGASHARPLALRCGARRSRGCSETATSASLPQRAPPVPARLRSPRDAAQDPSRASGARASRARGHRRVQPRQRHGIFQQDRRQHGRHRRRNPRPASGEHS